MPVPWCEESSPILAFYLGQTHSAVVVIPFWRLKCWDVLHFRFLQHYSQPACRPCCTRKTASSPKCVSWPTTAPKRPPVFGWTDNMWAILNGDKKMLLLPGKHEITVRQPWYKDYVEQAVLEPGEVHTINLLLVKDTRTPAKDATGELKISATPTRAAVFVDEQFTGHVDEFDGLGKAMLLTPGKHRVRVALPGYLPFETVVDLRPHQKLKIQTELEKGSIAEAGSLVSRD